MDEGEVGRGGRRARRVTSLAYLGRGRPANYFFSFCFCAACFRADGDGWLGVRARVKGKPGELFVFKVGEVVRDTDRIDDEKRTCVFSNALSRPSGFTGNFDVISPRRR
ncbi:hypothetical protein GWI33_016098 [Rhynchophorus ferrugineus]|uniref:Uncharacterized protein n=1 Tax=Rhynchophorus ferrugineus TaxID=354439 RepID=A0A834I2D8_RHYFE|nr:hypothetical protein GWI33_016098 [Rhynchophorus ferrugineus]